MVPDPDADWDHTRAPTMAVGTTPQPVFLQQRAPHGPAQRTRELLPYTNARDNVVNAMVNFQGLTDSETHKFERLMNLLGGDLHNRNFGFQIPYEEVQALAQQGDMKGLLDNLAAFDIMSEIRSGEAGPEDRYSSGDIARMMRAGDIDPEKINRFMELFADRSQFAPLMDAIVHQPPPSDEVPHEVKRERRAEQKGVEQAYNAYIRAVNNAKRTKSYIDDPYQTRLMEYDMAPLDEAPRNLGNAHPATVLREAIIRARAQQAQDALEGRPPMNAPKLRGEISDNRRTVGSELRNEMGGTNIIQRMPGVERLLGRKQERVQMIDRARRSRGEEDLR